MAFNLKNKKAQVGIGVPGAVGTLKQVTVDDIRNAKTDEDLEKIQNILTREQINTPELLEAMEAQKATLETMKNTQGLTGVAPVQEGTPLSVMPVDHGAKAKVFNLKKAQEALPPMDPMGLNDAPEIMGDQLEQQMDYSSQPKFKDGSDVMRWLDSQKDLQAALQFITGYDDGSGAVDLSKELIEDYFSSKGEPMTEPRVLERKAGEIFDSLPSTLKEEGEIMGIQKHVGEIQSIIEKIAKQHVSPSEKNMSFNLKKQAQHKALDNVIMWGPSAQPRIDPFLRQPISDWHIVERNKGFGLVVDDIWNIDYEAIWRQNIMDKYSRPYRDKDGNWVGGYIQKRFEVDKNIPASNNIQLKPGQRRKPVLPEYGNTESRLQAARAKGDIEGAIDTSKPFNWKEASSKKKS